MLKFFPIKFVVTTMLILSVSTSSLYAVPSSFSEVVNKTADGVVNISTTKTVTRNFYGNDMFRFFFGDEQMNPNSPNQNNGGTNEYKTSALGSGFLIDTLGYIVTNHHVIDGADEIIIKFNDDKEFEAKVVGVDPLTDLALLKIDPKGARLMPLILGDIDRSNIGDWVIAIGNPLGLGGTVTAGIISAKGRVIGDGPYDNFIQTDASINPGNSGGPLLNMQGEVIGVNTAIIQSAQGLGFAIPINMLVDILPKLRQGKVDRGWLGVTLQELDDQLAKSFGKSNTDGVLIADVVPNDPADRAGIRAGDIIVAVNNKSIKDARGLSSVIGNTSPNDRVVLNILRDGKNISVSVKLGVRPTGNKVASKQVPNKQSKSDIEVANLSQNDKSRLKIDSGVIVSYIKNNSEAYNAGLRQGDIVVWFNKQNVASANDFYKKYNSVKKSNVIGLKILSSSGQVRFIAFTKK